MASTPVLDGLEILTRPLSRMCNASPGSPWRKMTSPRRNLRVRAPATSAAKSSGPSAPNSGIASRAARSMGGSALVRSCLMRGWYWGAPGSGDRPGPGTPEARIGA
jgi:hypothetical protein